MKIKYVLTFIAFLLSLNVCYASSIPEWVEHPYKQCASNEICASGNGESLNSAKTDARNNILKYFETNVKSSFKTSLSSDEETVKQFSAEDTEELTEGILKGVKIKETFQDDEDFFAFAVLDKNIAVKEITNDIKELDTKMKLLLAEKNPKYNKQLEKNYNKREDLNKKYLMLTGNMIPNVVKYEDIFKNKKISGNLVYYVKIKNDDLKETTNYLKSTIINNNFKITDNKNQADRIITLSISKKDMYLNVDGFVKQRYSLTIKIFNNIGKEIQILDEDFVEIGRSETQIKNSIDIQIRNYLDDNLEEILQ
ncbi:MAG TPA: LPP20 family lipoprotein [Rickettsiales bacterium]|nr:LPP20 family lipoprotein [Rickettsiales bacterium]